MAKKTKILNHLGYTVTLRDKGRYTELDIKSPSGERFGKNYNDKRPDQSVSMLDNEAFHWQILEWIKEHARKEFEDNGRLH